MAMNHDSTRPCRPTSEESLGERTTPQIVLGGFQCLHQIWLEVS